VALYERGQTRLYLLQELDPSACDWAVDASRVQLGDSRLETRIEGGRRTCAMHVDVPLPGRSRRLTGTVHLVGAPVRPPAGLAGDPRHQWTPLTTAAAGRADFRVDGQPFLTLRGRAYHDRNGSTAPLDGLGIRHWVWGRAPAGEGERVWYLLWPHQGPPVAWGLDIAPDGVVQVHASLGVRRSGPRVAGFGMPWWRRLDLTLDGAPWLQVDHRRLVDSGFFYLRWLTTARTPDGAASTGVSEAVRPGRVDRAWNRPLVRMAVHHRDGPNSPFLPLFAGVRHPWGRPAIEEAPA